MWGILTAVQSADFEEVTIDASASWKPVPIKSEFKEEEPGMVLQRFRVQNPGGIM